jgi:hypothetical protein
MSLAALLLLTVAAHADVYRDVDAHGVKQYTDKPQSLPAQRLSVQSRSTDPGEVTKRIEDENKDLGQTDRSRQSAQKQQQDQKEVAELTLKDKADRCIKARERYEKFMTSQRLYKTTDKQEREYLSDAETDAARQNAKQTMEDLCK